MARIRWQGHLSPFDDPDILRAIVDGRAPVALMERLRRFEHHERVAVVPGRSEMIVGPEHGFSRTYVWGPDDFTLEMERDDWERLRANPWDGPMFRDLDEEPIRRRSLGRDGWRRLMEAFDRLPALRREAR